jgi:hemolysin III
MSTAYSIMTRSRLKIKSTLRDPFSSLSHLAGAAAALIGLVALLVDHAKNPVWTISIVIYGLSLFLMFFASGIYHAVVSGPRVIQILRKMDHSAIYLLIAGTYTPFCMNAFNGFWKWGFLAVIWGLAVCGILVKIFFIHSPRWITAGVYVVMGWLSAFAVHEMLSTLPVVSIVWLVTGGLIYTLGAVVYTTRRMNFYPGTFGFHEVWHIFVILAAAAHFIAVANIVLPPGV